MYIKVRVITGARKEIVEKVSGTQFKISVKEKAVHNFANNRVLQIIAMEYNVGVREVKIVNGQHTSTKLLNVRVVE